MPRAGIALGSNLGDRLVHLRAALAALLEIATPGAVVLKSAIYQTEPRDCPPGSPQFLNAVVEIGYDGSAFDLLKQTQAIEMRLGRKRSAERNAPRLIDIDLLYLGNDCLDSSTLALPHPGICERRFVLQPLVDIRPDLTLPGMDQPIAAILHHLDSDEPVLVNFPHSL
jgi:2-amino-4-hydroxy-6-hydroxymethyldihydropteridine diphosphokinase